MSNLSARLLIGACAIVVVGVAAFTLWELWWSLAGLGAFAEEAGQPNPDGPVQATAAEVRSRLDGYATSRLNRLTLVVPISGLCVALVLAIVAARLGRNEPDSGKLQA